MERRSFLRNTLALSVVAVNLPRLHGAPGSLSEFLAGDPKKLDKIGVQLYTLRDAMADNPVGTLKAISSIGYSHVECAGYQNGKFYGQTKENFKAILRDTNLLMPSGHTMTGNGLPEGTYSMQHRWENVCEDAVYMGMKYIVCAYFFDGERKTIDDYKKNAALMNRCAEKAKEYGLVFCHHNHDFEFQAIDGIIPYDILLNETDPKLVKFELDHYWTKKAGIDSLKLMKKHPGRFPVFHIKDMENSPEKSFAEVGSGTIQWKKIFQAGQKAGMEYFFVEQDVCKRDPMESIRMSYNYLKGLTY
jgi:sugar phosphate isomerase/epimerase